MPPESERTHVIQCVRKHGTKGAVRNCNRCKYVKNRSRWGVHCPWLVESPAPDSSWGLGCKICAFADNAPRHSFTTAFQMARCENSNSADQPEVTAGQDGQAVPTPAQIRLALEVARCPLGAQGCEYARRAELASRSDSGNFPHQFNDRLLHIKVLDCT